MIIINFSILRKVIDSIGSCPECNSCIVVTDDNDKRSGFCHRLNFKCTKCKFQYCNFTYDSVKKTVPKQGRNYFDINHRMVIAFREIGKGHQALVDLARIAKTSSINNNAFNKINNTIQNAYKLSAEQSTKAAAIKVKNKAKEEHIGSGKKLIRVSSDGSWQKRGHVSLNGVVTTISEGRCINFEVFCKYFRGCIM